MTSSQHIIRVIESKGKGWVGHVTLMGIEEVRIGFLVRNPEGKRQLGRPKGRWEDNIKTGVQ